MDNTILSKERTYWARDIASFLDISSSTLRKWCLLLEEQGYIFIRDDNDRRAFTERDVIALKKLKELTKDGTMSLENASIAISSQYQHSVTTDGTHVIESVNQPTRPIERFNEVIIKINELAENGKRQEALIKKQEALIQMLLQQTEKQEKLLNNVLNERDEQLCTAIEEIKEARKQIAAMNEERKKSFWQRVFGK